MNPLMQEALASILRWVFALGAGYLVKQGIWSEGDATTYVAAAALAVIALGWSLYQKWWSRQKLATALALSNPTTEAKVEAMVADNKIGTPPATVPKDVVPKMLTSE